MCPLGHRAACTLDRLMRKVRKKTCGLASEPTAFTNLFGSASSDESHVSAHQFLTLSLKLYSWSHPWYESDIKYNV